MRLNFRFSVLSVLLMAMALAIFGSPHSVIALQLAAAHIVSAADPGGMGLGMAGVVIGDILASPTIAPFPTIPELLAIKMAYRNPSYIADAVFPRIRVPSQKYAYIVYDKADSFRVQDTAIGRKSQLNQVETKATLVNGCCLPFGLREMVPLADIENAATVGMDPLAIATSMISGWVALDREKRVAALAFDASNYDDDHKDSLITDEKWDGAKQTADGNAVAQILAALDSCIMRPNSMAIGRLAFSALATNASVLKSVHGNLGDAGIATKQQIANLFELQEINVGESFLTSSKKGQAAAFSRVWGKNCLLYYKDANLMRPDTGISYGFTAAWKQFAGAMPDKNIGPEGGQEVRAGEYVEEKIMAADCAFLISAVSTVA